MTDIIIVICCIGGGFAIGKFIENRVVAKGKFYQDMSRYISLLRENIGGKQLEIDRFNQEFASNCSADFADYLLNRKIKLKLTRQQLSNINVFFDNLCCSGSQALYSHLDYYSKLFASDVCAMQSAADKAAVYGKLGMLLGAMVGILLI